MHRHPRLFRLIATAAVIALFGDAALPLAAAAQPAPPPLPRPGQGRPDLYQGDPPARVGRIAGLTGTVAFHNTGDTSWNGASVNYPVSGGNSFWTEPSASARLEISDSRVVMNGGTEFDVATLDADGLRGIARQGEIYLHLRDLAPNEVWSVQTPRGLVHLNGAGRYAIAVGSTDQPTQVTVIDGSARIDGPGISLRLGPGQTATITGTDPFQGGIAPAAPDAFLNASLNAERPPPAAVAIPAQVVRMPGGSDLIGTGNWSDAPTYGRVWYPPVSAQWVPYREGHWAYVAPWGWTWIDNAPWGFAPFHYGRWVEIGGRWAWTPGAVAVAQPPVYAPALVTFIGIGAGVAVGAALASGSVGWVPLGPREAFHPWYHASPAYVREVNTSHVTNIRNITNVTVNNYVNRAAATSVPAAAMRESRPVQAVARSVTRQEFAAARPIVGQQPLRPAATTAGVTQAVARHLDLAPAPAGHAAPGPAVHPREAGGGSLVRPALAPAAHPHAPAAATAHPAATITQPTSRPTSHPEAQRPSPEHASRPAQQPVQVGHAGPGHAAPAQAEITRPAPHPEAQRPSPEHASRPARQPAPIGHPEPAHAELAHPEPARAQPPHPVPHLAQRPPTSQPRPEARPAAPRHPEPHQHQKPPG